MPPIYETDPGLKTQILANQFKDELPRPGVLRPTNRQGGTDRYEIELTEFQQQVLPSDVYADLQADGTTVWGYEGSFPGPTIEATPGDPVEVEYVVENLPPDYSGVLGNAVDENVHGAEPHEPVDDWTATRIVTHLHGGVVRPVDDGYPEAWVNQKGFTAEHFGLDSPVDYKQTKEYPNDQQPGTLWYHDHALGSTRINVYTGLAGFYLLRDRLENQLPNRRYEVPIVIQDRTFDANGGLFYPPGDDNDYEPEFAGDIPVVNGKAYPKLTVEPRTYRLRFLNGSNGQTFNLQLFNETAGSDTDVPVMKQIGVDLGFLDDVVPVGPGQTVDSLLLSGAERADTIVDFSDFAGQSFLLKNDAEYPYAGENSGPGIASMGDIMRIEVEERGSRGDSIDIRLPRFLDQINQKYPDPEVEETDVVRTHSLDSAGLNVDGVTYDSHFLNASLWSEEDAIVNPQLGTSEEWELYNTTPDSHPIHLHLVDFEVLERQSFEWGGEEGGETEYQDAVMEAVNNPDDPNVDKPNVKDYTSLVEGTVTLPNPNNATNKDTVLVNPLEVVRIEPAFTGYEGLYAWHCHILEHEDQEMMLPYEVVDENG
ncbi:multicopper oxidase family protein [Haloarchaeobius sp. HRN-SO-5]|uniref:multicopper oxidase family protein n=1 Tax=Haloarchaeobius sp. HRN-SO-5 TaxID=3446118 RepID=UPI003EBCC9BA